jgi:hypothetical protein
MGALSATTRESLVGIADRLIPAEGEMPGAGSVLEQADFGPVLEELPDLVPAVEAALGGVAGEPEEARFAALAERDPEGLAAVGEMVAAVYFLDPEVSRLVGYRRREAVPIDFDPDLVELTRPVVTLGFRSPVSDGG